MFTPRNGAKLTAQSQAVHGRHSHADLRPIVMGHPCVHEVGSASYLLLLHDCVGDPAREERHVSGAKHGEGED